MAEMTEKQMEMLLKSDADRTRGFTQEEMDEMQQELDRQNLEDKQRQDEEMKEEFSPGLEEDRTAPLKEEPETRKASADMSVGEFVASMLGDDKNEEVVTAAEGGSIEKEADFVKDDDEEPADPPPGATPEEVADDIPAYLSTGEYVLPANVVRYIGLQQIVAMHKGALSELQQMEDLDIIENVDENGMVEEDDDEMDYLKEPKGVVKTTLVVAKPHPSGMMAMPFAEGGEADAADEMDPENDLGQSAAEMGDVGAFGGPDSPAEAGGVSADVGDAMQESLERDAVGGGTEPAPGSDTYQEAEKGLQQALDDRGFFEKLEDNILDLAYDFTNPSSKTDIPNSLTAVLGPLGLPAQAISGILGKLSDAGYEIDPDSAGPNVDDRDIGGGEPDDPITKQAKEDDETEKTKQLIEELERSKGGKRYKVDPVEALRFGQLGEEYTRGSFFQR